MQIFAFFDSSFGSDEAAWRRLREARPISRQHFSLNLPSSLGQYDLNRQDQVAPIVGLARKAGIDGFVLDLVEADGDYRHAGALLAPFCGSEFGLALRWCNKSEPLWRDPADAVRQMEQAERLVAALRDFPARRIDGRIPLIVQAPETLAAPAAQTAMLRMAAERAGLSGLYLIASRAEDQGRFLSQGFDCLLDPPPQDWHSCQPSNRASGLDYLEVMAGLRDSVDYLDRFFPYLSFSVSRMAKRDQRGKCLPLVFGAFHDWLDHPEGGATHLVASGQRAIDTQLFGMFIENAMLWTHRNFSPAERVVFLHSWNCWFDGSQMEPSLLDGDLVYNTVRAAIDRGRYVIRTRGESPADIDDLLKERIAVLCRLAGEGAA